MSGVGLWVVLACVALALSVPQWLAQWAGGALGRELIALVALIGGVAVLQAPFDLLGGYLLPRRHGRSPASFGGFALGWVRGVMAYSALMLFVAVLTLFASRAMGPWGFALAGAIATLAALMLRTPLAGMVGAHRRASTPERLDGDVRVLDAPDIGFTGGIVGVFRPRAHLLPERWISSLGAGSLTLALARRREAVASGLWLRGRIGALAFVWTGLALAAFLSRELAGTAGGVLAGAAVFTLWSFVGLLVLPTLSRRASHAVDARLLEAGVDPDELRALASALDTMQDDEPTRPGWIEAIFHTIPSVDTRLEGEPARSFAAWDIARTAAFLGLAGLSPLGRAVHCNSGRPDLWIYLPLD